MPTIIVEDGSLVAGANSYVSTAELVAYAADRGITIVDDESAEILVVKAMDYIEALEYKGIKFTYDQPLLWPRANVFIDDYLVYVDEIPADLKKAVFEVALSINNEVDPLENVGQVQQRVKVGPLEVEYAEGSSPTPIVKKITYALRKLLRSGMGSSFEVRRG